MPETAPRIDAEEVEKFEAIAAEWWDPKGKFAPLHKMQPVRLRYLVDQIAAQFGRNPGGPESFDGLTVVDLGCGGGLLCEPMARLGANVLGVDASHRAISVAQAHAQDMELDVAYRCATVEEVASDGVAAEVVLAMEIVEHLPDPGAFLLDAAKLVKPGGLLIASTLNRNAKSFLSAIVGAEYLLSWLPRGTHDWRKFLTPDELAEKIEAAGLKVVDRKGMVYRPMSDDFALSSSDLSVNYVITAEKRS
ncbi:MAG: bifunctional 2-polyprenyl-6-hydroxyphenol methylase/3-demethylubiquinol 3-O-methyltransferase UbiG [Pseudomonadota bacterium]